jgi:ubiquinone/menaquinone biosynthesis C-methylase UbiE
VILNRVEKALMNNPLRASLQRWYEARLLQRLGGKVPGGRVVELGCGRGVGTEIVLQRFEAARVLAFDLDPDMVRQAFVRLGAKQPGRVILAVADAAVIPAPSGAFDAVFDFGIVHHVPAWREVLSEVHRVLKTGGRFFFEEVTQQALNRWLYRTFLQHPTEDRFSARQFLNELNAHRLKVRAAVERVFGDFVLGVAEKVE